MTYTSAKAKNEAIELLRGYSGSNPYYLMLKRDVILKGDVKQLNAFNVEYVIENQNFIPKQIGKTIKIADWYGLKKQQDWGTEFTPQKLRVISLLGETSTTYHCYVQYRQSVDPVMAFLPKKAVLTNFTLPDWHDYPVDFDRYDKLSTSKDPNRKLKLHQKDGIKFLLARKKCVLADEMGYGKMEPIDAEIPTPSGFKKMGELSVGDMIFGEDGKEHPIIKIFEHKNKPIYRVNFSDGTSCECGLDHLWKVRTKNMTKRKQGWKVMALKDIIASGFQYADKSRIAKGQNPRSKYEIPVCDPVEYSEKKYLIDPYILGVCIGDGNLCNGIIAISIPDFEKETADRISSLLPENMMLKEDRSTNCPRYRLICSKRSHTNPFIQEIKRLGLNVHGDNKFIPEEYKIGSISQRIEILRGLMDSDGTITKERNRIIFSSNSKTLCNDVMEIVYSLGGIARLRKYQRDGRKPEYSVSLQVKFNPFHLQRKAVRFKPTYLKYCSKYMVSAEFVRNTDARCLMLDYKEHTYLTGKRFIVTHNTCELAVAAIEGNFDAVLIICPASIKTNWKKELMWYVPERDITIIESYLDKNKGELEKFLGYKEGKSGLSLTELQNEAKEAGKWDENRFVIVNYDILDEFYQIPETRSKENINIAYQNSPLLQYISGKKTLIIIDEAHRLSNTTSGRYKIIRDLIKRGNPDSIYLATGTPITNNPQNYFNLLQLIGDPVADDREYYLKRYCNAIEIPRNAKEKAKRDAISRKFIANHGKKTWYDLTDAEKDELHEIVKKSVRMMTIPNGEGNLDELRDRTAHIYLRRVKKDLKGLPNKTVHELFYDLNLEQTMEYNRLWEEYEAAQLDADPTKDLNKELLEGAIYRKYLSNQMVPNTIKLTDSFIEKGEKVVIACCYDEELYALRDYYGDKCVIYNGKISAKEKDTNVERFTNDPNVKVLIGNIISAGVGINLVAARIVIFNNISYVPGDDIQFEDRVYRITQTRDVDIYYQIFKDTQYEKMWNIVLRKSLVINQIVKKEDEK